MTGWCADIREMRCLCVSVYVAVVRRMSNEVCVSFVHFL